MKKSDPVETAVVVILGMLVAFPLALWRGFVITKLWMWFVSPTFHTSPIGLMPAVGISLLIGFITHQSMDTKDKTATDLFGEQVGGGLVIPAFALFWGWVYSFWM